MIPIATTRITVLRVPADPERDPTDPEPAALTVASGVRAQISTSRWHEETRSGASQEVTHYRMSCDPVDLHHRDRVRDESTGEEYEVTAAVQRRGLGLDHTQAGLHRVSGVVS